jgi:hypothetical protein
LRAETARGFANMNRIKIGNPEICNALPPWWLRIFSTVDVLKLLNERPELAKLGTHVEQKNLGE